MFPSRFHPSSTISFIHRSRNGMTNTTSSSSSSSSTTTFLWLTLSFSSSSSAKWLKRQSKDEYVQMAQRDGLPSRAFYKLKQLDDAAVKYIHKKHIYKQTAKTKRKRGLFQKGDTVIDLGATPGGWSIYASKKIGPSGLLLAIDLLEMSPATITSISHNTPFVTFQGDFTDPGMKHHIADSLYRHHHDHDEKGRQGKQDSGNDTQNDIHRNHFQILNCRADVIISDMAANFIGDPSTDALRTMSLCEEALMFAIGSSSLEPDNHKVKEMDVSSFLSPSLSTTTQTIWKDFGLLQIGGTFLCKYFSCGEENEKDLKDAMSAYFDHVNVIKPSASRKESAEKYMLGLGFKGNSLLNQVQSMVSK